MIETVGDLTSFKWATVTALSPLAIKLDGDTAPLALVPETITDPAELFVGSRVRVELTQRKVVVHGVAKPGVGLGTTQIAMLDAQYRGSGPAKVYWLPSLALSADSYEWETPYVPWGNRAVTMVRRSDGWKIQGHSGHSLYGAKLRLLFSLPNVSSYNEVTSGMQYSEPRYTRLPSGIVVLSGLVTLSSGVWTTGQVIANLPVGYRPDTDMLFQVNNADNPRILQIKANGDITTYGTWVNSYFSLDGIAYPAAGVATWTEVGSAGSGSAFANGFGPHTGAPSYGAPAFWKDPYDIVWFRGLVRNPTTPVTDAITIFSLPTSHTSPLTTHVPVGSSNGSADAFGMISAGNVGGILWKNGSLGSQYISLARMTIITAAAMTNPLNYVVPASGLISNWVNYGGTFSTFKLLRRADGLGMTEGLIRAGTLNAMLFRLPVELQTPRTSLHAIARNNAVFGRIDQYGFRDVPALNGSGAMWGHTVEAGWTSLDGLKWMVGE